MKIGDCYKRLCRSCILPRYYHLQDVLWYFPCLREVYRPISWCCGSWWTSVIVRNVCADHVFYHVTTTFRMFSLCYFPCLKKVFCSDLVFGLCRTWGVQVTSLLHLTLTKRGVIKDNRTSYMVCKISSYWNVLVLAPCSLIATIAQLWPLCLKTFFIIYWLLPSIAIIYLFIYLFIYIFHLVISNWLIILLFLCIYLYLRCNGWSLFHAGMSFVFNNFSGLNGLNKFHVWPVLLQSFPIWCHSCERKQSTHSS